MQFLKKSKLGEKMQYCAECNAVEQGTLTKTDDHGTEYEVCACCESDDDTIRHFDEDAGKDR